MRMRMKFNRVVLGATIAIGLLSPRLAWAQSDSLENTARYLENTARELERLSGQVVVDAYWAVKNDNGRAEAAAEKKAARALQQRYHQAVAAYRDAENDNGRTEAAAKIKQVLEIYFQTDMETRQQELKQIAERLKKLEAQLARRTEKKQEIVDLQLKVVLNEAEGLGFSGSNAVLDSLPDILVSPWETQGYGMGTIGIGKKEWNNVNRDPFSIPRTQPTLHVELPSIPPTPDTR